MNIQLYHCTHSRSLRVLWLLEEMGLSYQLNKIDLALGNTGGSEFAKINTLQKVPAVQIGGETMIESTAILEFLANRFGGESFLISPDHVEYRRFLQWLHGGESAFGMYLSLYFGHSVLLPKQERNKAIRQWAALNLQKAFAAFSEDLSDRKFITAENFTIADISVGFVAYGMELLGKLDEMAPQNVQNWWQDIRQRPALVKAISL